MKSIKGSRSSRNPAEALKALIYKGLRCGYNGSKKTCDHTLTDCRAHGNSKRFGGFVGIDQLGVYRNK